MKITETIQQECLGSSPPYYQVLCARLAVDESKSIIKVRKTHPRWDGQQWIEIHVGQAWLPATPLHPIPSRLSDHPALFFTIVAAVDSHLIRQPLSKSTHAIAGDIVKTLVKTFEYIWVRGYYSVSKVPEVEWRRLAALLAEGGWFLALEIDARIARITSSVEDPKVYLRAGHSKV
ncbi:MAG: hypothetical protein EON54_13505, partial [Alcaligenaceae bacterium]